MDINEIRVMLEDIVNSSLYKCSKLNKKQKESLRKIKNFLEESDNFIEDLRTILTTRNGENYFAYDKYISDFFVTSKYETKKEVLMNQDDYRDIIKCDEIFINIWQTLECEQKIEYLTTKKTFSNLDIKLINTTIADGGNFKDNVILEEIINNDDVRKKIPNHSIDLKYSFNTSSMINLNDTFLCSVFTLDSYTNLLLKKCKNFKEFKELYESNEKIIDLIAPCSLVFNSSENKDIYSYLLMNPNLIGKFECKYLELFNIIELGKIYISYDLDSYSFSSIIQKLYKYNEDEANTYFSEDNLRKCPKHSIKVNPFDKIDSNLRDKIIDNYELFNRFLDTIMIESINSYFDEEAVVNILRNDSFIDDVSSYAIELLLNKLSFKSAFNMLQRKVIFDKIHNLHVSITPRDNIFVKGYLDSPVLVHKSEHSMLYEMLNVLDSSDVLYYIVLPYIANELSNYEICKLIVDKNINLEDIVESKELNSKLNVTDLISIINKVFKKEVNLEIFRNRVLCKKLFNIDDDLYNNIDFNEVDYLFETIKMKSLLSKQLSDITVLTYKSVLASYLVIGLEETIELVNKGNMSVTLDKIKKLQVDVVNEKILLFKENNSAVFQNMTKKIINNLASLKATNNINNFQIQVRKNTYLDNLIYLMLDNDFDSYNEIIDKLFGFLNLYISDEYKAMSDVYDYSKRFINVYLGKKTQEYNEEFEKIILKNFKPKENIIYKKRKEIGKDFLDKLKFNLFVRALTDSDKDYYKEYFKDNFPIYDIKDKYLKYIDSVDVDFDSIYEHVLVPIINNRFDKENCLNKLGIKKPENTHAYIKYLEDLDTVDYLNNRIDKFKKKYNYNELIEIMNYICYLNSLSFKVSKNLLLDLNRMHEMVLSLDNEIYIDKAKASFEYQNTIDIYNIEEIEEYNKYLSILDDIVHKTQMFINRYMDKEKILKYFSNDYYKAINTDDCVFPITNKYYEPIRRVLSLKDIEIIFNGYDLSNVKKLDSSLKKFLFDDENVIMVVDGYYTDLVDNLGVIISKWDKIKENASDLNVDLNTISLIGLENILTLINFEDDTIGKALDKDIVQDIYDDGYYEINDIGKRSDMLIELFKDSYKRISSTVPYLVYKDDLYRVEILDNYNRDILRSINGSMYKVGAIGNDLLHYSILDKNGFQLAIYKENVLVDKVLGVRNGNTIYLNALEGDKNPDYNELLRVFAKELVKITKNDVEPIDFVTIVNNAIYTSRNGLVLDNTLCPYVNNPINKNYNDYREFSRLPNLLNVDNMYTNYEDNITTLLASNNVVDKNNFKSYDVESKYYRKRNDAIKLSNNIGEEYLSKIDIILYLCKMENEDLKIDDISLSNIDVIYLGDDYVVFVTNKKNVFKYVLPYDERANKEVDIILSTIKKDK